jgi:hypothetical protein
LHGHANPEGESGTDSTTVCLAGCRKGPPALEDCCLVFELDETNQMDEITRQIGRAPGVQAI